MFDPDYYLDQLERHLADAGLGRDQIRKALETVIGYGDARYDDGFDYGKTTFRSGR